MKHFLNYIIIITALILTGCTNEVTEIESKPEPVIPDSIPAASPETTDSLIGVYSTVPEFIYANDIFYHSGSRSSLYLDRTSDKMIFSWGDDDSKANMGVVLVDEDYNPWIPTNYVRKPGQSPSALYGSFVTEDNKVTPLKENAQYIAFRPFEKALCETDFAEINFYSKEIHFTGQSNHENVKRAKYYNESDAADYEASEKAAASHLGAYDYLISDKQTTRSDGSVNFPLQRVGVVVCFFIKCPNAEVFEQVQLVTQGDSLFTLDGTIDLTNREITPTKQSNVMVLSYDYDSTDKTNHPGIDMTNTSSDYYRNGTGYIISYMMLAPINLTQNDKPHLYLVSHDSNNNKKYYKSAPLDNPNLTSNMFYRWRSADNKDDSDNPITFTEVSFQEWQTATTPINNSDQGNGTQKW